MTDCDPFAYLGIPYGSSPEIVRKAYHRLIRKCHPDLFHDEKERKAAEEQTARLNNIYEEALRLVSRKNTGTDLIPFEEAKKRALTLLRQNQPELALRQLTHSDCLNGEWYCLQGDILYYMKKYEEAHAAYREAINFDPENRRYREGALNAAVSLKKSNTLGEKVLSWLKNLKLF